MGLLELKEEFVVVMVTASSEVEAATIGRHVVEEELAACCNIVPSMRSIYRWKGKVCDEAEALCIMKTRAALFTALSERVKELHSYEVPEIISLSIEDGSRDYLDWIAEMTQK